ncbi:putative ATPase [Mycobacterium sp. JS623]|uniref:AAA family ATPase n=1 Tax=Mycobacterium sp. JS623 TaxID=212767 RepID=UPI0002A59EFD|nr:AAA family ATPase [Mycobacterium sp. JS623]AGB22983.1 putative ATPase [Mycobacterium sp. JS623]
MVEHRRTCAACGTPNEEDARFCEGCGASLARECATCGMEARASARFCRGCGAPLDSQVPQGVPAAGPVRKTVTVMFADLAGSTGFEEQVDAETAREVIGRYHDLLRSTAEHHRAGLTKYIGDGFMAVWGVPEIGPDDAAKAVEAAVELQEHFVDLAAMVIEIHGVELALRVAVNTGEVVVGAGDADLVGDALNVGARLEAECPRGRVVVGEETWRSTRGRHGYESLGAVQVKGRSAPVAVYQWLGRRSDTDATPFVGRAEEARRLQAVLDEVVAARAARMITVIGDPGVGKSRLAAEFTGALGDARTIPVRCDVAGTVALAPIVEVLRSSDLETDIPPSIPERDRLLRDLNGLVTGVPGSVEENFWALRRFVEVLASDCPVILVLDDIQWADALLLDFIEHLVEWVQEAPILLLALARPELREIRPDLGTVSRWVTGAVHLDGLDADATAELAAKVLGATALPAELLHRLPSSTGGNPLFVRELIGMLAHDGVLVQEPTGWRLAIDVDAITIPPTIHALLASRLERLNASDRRVLEVASVIGNDFSPEAVSALARASAAEIMVSLNRLRRLELAQPSGAYVGDEPVWRFHHVLIRDVAYRRLLKSDRADLHERLADWVEAGGSGVAFESDEIIARNLEAAHSYRLELGTPTGDLALRSAHRYAASARRALDRDELVSAGTQAAHGAALAAADESLHAELLLIGCEAFLSAGDVAAGGPLVDELDRIAGDALAPWATCYRCQFVVYTSPERLLEVDTRLQSAIDEFSRRNDPAGLAKAHRVRAGARARLGRIGDCEGDLFEALIAARRSGDHRQITAALGAAPGAALWGPSPVPKAGGRCLDVVRMQRMTTAAPSLEATSLRCLAVLEMLRGRSNKARTMLADARQVVADLGLRHGLMETELFAGIIESMEGDPIAAEPHFRTALEGLDALGVGADAGQAAALLARSVLVQGRLDEADRYATESEHLAGRNLKTAIAWRAVRAEILATQGRHDEAAAMARDAVAVAAGTDLVLDHAEACLALSRVLAAAGDAKGANAARAEAESLYAAKEVASPIDRGLGPAVAAAPASEAGSETSRLTLRNRASQTVEDLVKAMLTSDVDTAIGCYSDPFVSDDRRLTSGEPIPDNTAMRSALTRILLHYSRFDSHVLAVRGERLVMSLGHVSNDAGYESTYLLVHEIDESGRLAYEGRFDEDDFESAYRELDRRYYSGDGVVSADAGGVITEWLAALNRGDFDRAFGELISSEAHLENRSRAPFTNDYATEIRTGFEGLNAMVASARLWNSAVIWLSPTVMVCRFEREAIGPDGENYAWAWFSAGEIRDGQIAAVCSFDLEDETAAFAYAETRLRGTTSRLAITNESCEFLPAFIEATRAHDVDATLSAYADEFVYDDRRRLSGDPIVTRDAMRTAIERVFEHYTRFEFRVLAVRGQRLHLLWSRWSDDDGNQTPTLYIIETDDDRRVSHFIRFDDDDFEGAYLELERRYYAGEGAAFAEPGATVTDWVMALNRGDLDRILGELSTPDIRIENRSRSALPDLSAAGFRESIGVLDAMVTSARTLLQVLVWLSPTVVVGCFEREAIGHDGEHYSWTRLHVSEIRNGRLVSACQFDVEDEEAAFAYAEERVRSTPSWLAVSNSASDATGMTWRAMQTHDHDAVVAAYADPFVYDDRRRFRGDPIESADAMRTAVERMAAQYPYIEWRTLAVRGERLVLHQSRFSDDAGNETAYLHVREVDDDGRVTYDGRFDEDDFEGAYRELERRYYAGEGAAFAEGGAIETEWVVALNQGDFGRLFGELTAPDMRVMNRSRSVFVDRSAAEVRGAFDELNAMVTWSRSWNSAMCWLSPTIVVLRFEREASGLDREKYTWTWLHVSEIREGRFAAAWRFELDDEDAAFALAEERVRATTSRLAVTNRATQMVDTLLRAMQGNDVRGAVALHSENFMYDDRRRLSGDPIESTAELFQASARLLEQYPHIEGRVLAVRGERLELRWTRWWDDDGNEATYLTVFEVDDDGRIDYHGRFDGDDFESAYRELERRYYAGEGAAFAAGGAVGTEWVTALNRGDFDRLFNELTAPDLRVENRSLSVFGDPTAAEFRATFEELNGMVASTKSWSSALCWLSPEWGIARLEREAIGQGGEKYTWARLHVTEIRDGRLVSLCRFELEDEAAAFAYVEERVRATTSRLAVTNRASQVIDISVRAMQTRDVNGALALSSDRFVYEDHRHLSGDPFVGLSAMRRALERLLAQYSHLVSRTLAVRGERLELRWSRWWDDDGNEETYLTVCEVDDVGRVEYQGRFDGDDFVAAYRELERRYYAGEGAASAESGAVTTEFFAAENQGDLDRAFGDLTSPGFRVENRSRSVFGDRSGVEFRASREEFGSMVESVRSWHSAIRWPTPTSMVGRFEREAVGLDGERYVWSCITSLEVRDGQLESTCIFELEDEEAAFAYAEQRARTATTRLPVVNRASQTWDAVGGAAQAHDVDGMAACYCDQFVYDDRRRLGGNPLGSVRSAVEGILAQYNQFESRTLAVRGEHLHLGWSRWSNDAGYETTYLIVHEVDETGLFVYEGRFEEDDFEGAYRELDRRYYSEEGAAFADAGAAQTEWLVTLNRGDLDRLFGELTAPEMRFEMRSSSAFADTTATAARPFIEDFNTTVARARTCHRAVRWVSPTCCVSRTDREAVGQDGEQYVWTRLSVTEFRDGQMTSEREFDLDDEAAAFAYAEQRASVES